MSRPLVQGVTLSSPHDRWKRLQQTPCCPPECRRKRVEETDGWIIKDWRDTCDCGTVDAVDAVHFVLFVFSFYG